MSAIPAGRRIVHVGIDGPRSTRGVEPDHFARRLQSLFLEFGTRAALVPELAVNPNGELWESTGLAMLVTGFSRWAFMAAFQMVSDGTVTSAELASVVARAYREAGAGRDVDAVALAGRLLGCSVPFALNQATDFDGVCMRHEPVAAGSPVRPHRLASATRVGDGSATWTLRAVTTARQGVRPVPVPEPVPPDSVDPAPPPDPDPAPPPDPDPKPEPESSRSWVFWGGLAAAGALLLGGGYWVLAGDDPVPVLPAPSSRNRRKGTIA